MNLRKAALPAMAFLTFFGFYAGAFNCEQRLLMSGQLQASDVRKLVEDAQTLLNANIEPPGTLPGTVIASPSKGNPDYFYMWIRDAALVMQVVQSRQMMLDYVDLSLHQQNAPAKSGLGEPKFNVDGTAYDGNWGRPQNDGPALRAITTIRFAQQLLAEGKKDYVTQKLYDGHLPTHTLIKTDLEYIAHRWHDPNYDLWEETYGRHLYTLLAQKRALTLGAELADKLEDGGAANFYRTEAAAIEQTLDGFWNGSYLRAIRDQSRGPDHNSGLDVAVILAALHSTEGTEKFGVTDDRILATAYKLEQSFQAIYKVNQIPEFKNLGTAIGRYPEDHYTGYETTDLTKANPWFLATNAYAELYYRAQREFAKAGEIAITPLNKPFFEHLHGMSGISLNAGQTLKRGDAIFDTVLKSLVEDGDRFIARVRFHSSNGHLSEQFDKDTGWMQGAENLTWSYASLITALTARP